MLTFCAALGTGTVLLSHAGWIWRGRHGAGRALGLCLPRGVRPTDLDCRNLNSSSAESSYNKICAVSPA
jgi:hypothetical protein